MDCAVNFVFSKVAILAEFKMNQLKFKRYASRNCYHRRSPGIQS